MYIFDIFRSGVYVILSTIFAAPTLVLRSLPVALAVNAGSAAPTVRFEVDGGVATYWNVHHEFALEARAPTLPSGGRVVVRAAPEDDGQACGRGPNTPHTNALAGPLAEGFPPSRGRTWDGVDAYWRWEGLQVTRGGRYLVCWCLGSSCAAASEFGVTGPSAIRNQHGALFVPGVDAAVVYRAETFAMQVAGANMSLLDRVRLIDSRHQCGGKGSARIDASFATSPRLPGGVPDDDIEADANTSFGFDLLTWSGMMSATAGSFRACWCSGRRTSDSEPEINTTTVTTTTTATTFYTTLGDRNNTTNASMMYEENGSNTTFGVNTTFGYFDLDVNHTNASLPEWGFAELGGDTSMMNTTNTTTTSTTTTAQTTVTTTVLATCDTDRTGELYSFDLGRFAVAGPTGFAVTDDETGLPDLRIARNFTLTVTGMGLVYGGGFEVQQRDTTSNESEAPEPTSAGRVSILSIDSGDRCGAKQGNDTSFNTEFLQGQLEEDETSPGSGTDISKQQSWSPLRIMRGGRFYVCWCSGNMDGGCNDANDFNLALGKIYVVFQGFALQNLGGARLRTVAGVEFSMRLFGEDLSIGDRIRVVDGSVECGGPGASRHTPTLRGPLARDVEFRGNLTLGEPLEGIQPLAVTDSTGSMVVARPGVLSYQGLRFTAPGLKRVCWCPGRELLGETPDPDNPTCRRDSEFYTEAAVFATVEVRAAWVDPCTRARRPFRIHLAALDVRPGVDRVLVTRATDVCGEGLPEGLIPGGDIAMEFGFAALRCTEDPNAGAAELERKLVCGDRKRAIMVDAPGLYRICLCVALPGYDCSHYTHYTIASGEPFEVASPAGPLTADNAAAAGGGAQPPMILGGAGGAVLTVAYSPQGDFVNASSHGDVRLAVGSEDGSIRIWEPSVPRMVTQLVGHSGRVDTLAWAPDASWLVSAGADGSVRLWGGAAGVGPGLQQLHPCPNWESVWERPNGDASDEVWQNVIFAHLLDVPPANVTQEYRSFEQDRVSWEDLKDTSALTLKRATLQCEKVCPAYREEAARFCDCGPSLECHHTHTCAPKCGLELHIWEPAHSLRVTAIGVTPDGRYVMSASVDTTVRIWDVTKDLGRRLAPGEVPRPAQILTGHGRAVLCLAFTTEFVAEEGAPVLATGGADGKIIWFSNWRNYSLPDVPTEPMLFLHEIKNALGVDESVYSISFSADGRIFAAAGANGGAIWDVNTRLKLQDFSPPAGAVSAAMAGVSMAPDGKWVALRSSSSVQLFPLSVEELVAAARARASYLEELENPNQKKDDDEEKEGPIPKPPQAGTWVPFSLDDLTQLTLSFTTRGGPEGNTPQHWVERWPNGSISAIYFQPCNVSRQAHLDACAESLPMIQLDIEVPYSFIAIRGYFVEFSAGDNRADDCRGGTFHSSWEPLAKSTSKEYFVKSADGYGAERKDCQRVGPWAARGNESVHACQAECLALGICNVLNYRQNPPSCDLRRCLDATKPGLVVNPDKVVYSLVTSDEADERVEPAHDGYVVFGAPNKYGEAGIVYPGCGLGADIDPYPGTAIELTPLGLGFHFDSFDYDITDHGFFQRQLFDAFRGNKIEEGFIEEYTVKFTPNSKIVIVLAATSLAYTDMRIKTLSRPLYVLGSPATVIEGIPVPLSRRLRFQVAQSQPGEVVGIRAIQLELFRPATGRRFLAEPSSSSAVSFAPSRRELAAAVGSSGNFGVWDLTGFDIASRSLEYKLKIPFDFDLTAQNLQHIDRVRVVSASDVPACGDPYSATSTRAVQGVGDGSPGGMIGGPDPNATENTLEWFGLAATVPDNYRICFCRGRPQACCDSDGDFSTEIISFTVAGANPGHYFVCETTPSGTQAPRWCQFNGITGVGLKEGDMIMVQDALACGLATTSVPGIPNKGVAISRRFTAQEWELGKFYEGGQWYRYEHEFCRTIAFDVKCTMDPDPVKVVEGLTARLCWCAKASGCSPDNPSEFLIDTGKVTIVKLQEQVISIRCIVGVSCNLKFNRAFNQPFNPGDLLVAKGPAQDDMSDYEAPANYGVGRQAYCTSIKQASGIGPAGDGISERMGVETAGGVSLAVFDFGLNLASTPGTYRLCWCQGSIRPCKGMEEFTFDIGYLDILQADYVWPQCMEEEQSAFTGWRFDYHTATTTATTYDECCCNFFEAGSVGCAEPSTEAICARFPRR